MRQTKTLLLLLSVCCAAAAQPKTDDPNQPYVLYDERGRITEQNIVTVKGGITTRRLEFYWPNGQIKNCNETRNYTEGYSQHIEAWVEDGTKTKDAYTDNSYTRGANQFFKEWYPNGTIYRKWNYYNSGDSVNYQVWYQNGNQARIFSTSKSRLHGAYISYDSTGIKRTEANYRLGVRHGKYTEWDNKGRMSYTNDYELGRPKMPNRTSLKTNTTDCKPVRYSDIVCDSISQLTRIIAAIVIIRSTYADIDTSNVPTETIDSVQQIINRIWNFLNIEKPNSFALNQNHYKSRGFGEYYNAVYTQNIENAISFRFSAHEGMEWKMHPSFTLLYYPDGSIEFPNEMLQISLYEPSRETY